MTDSGFLNMLGIAKRAALLSQGRDVSLQSVKNGRARLCLVASDASERLFEEFKYSINEKGGKVPIFRLSYSMDEIGVSLGYRVAVLTVNDAGIADRLIQIGNLLNGEEN